MTTGLFFPHLPDSTRGTFFATSTNRRVHWRSPHGCNHTRVRRMLTTHSHCLQPPNQTDMSIRPLKKKLYIDFVGGVPVSVVPCPGYDIVEEAGSMR
ncbi:unnamed protein product [Protopolystoma xenopodis]|uniref:Uncharacterized protein n=1 Tax=Protopolystoma xenopodis TaxID=117903 RepID=A0A3S5ASG7_9PLAT|nr:unnamed protein product [Protopolystoma xenopodis]